MQNLTRYDLAHSCFSDCACQMMEQPEGVYVKFYDIEKILIANNKQSTPCQHSFYAVRCANIVRCNKCGAEFKLISTC